MKILVTGINGQLGYDVLKELKKRNHEVIGVGRSDMDLTSTIKINKCIENVIPEAIIHCGAYTAVDMAQDNEELCTRVNSIATKDIAICAKKLDIPMIYISTDYVFDGKKGIEDINVNEYTKEHGIYSLRKKYIPYNEEDIPNPINIYGRTKLEGENFVRKILDKYYIVRISWVFGENGNNFIDTMLRLAKDKKELNIIHDQVGSPTYTKDLAIILADMIESDKYGIYHATNDGYCSWYEFAKEVFNISNTDMKLSKISTDMYKTKANRPLNSMMSKDKLVKNGFYKSQDWKSAIRDYLIYSSKHNI